MCVYIYIFKLDVNYNFLLNCVNINFPYVLGNWLYNLWHHHFQYNTSFLFRVYIYFQIVAHVFKLKINKNININIKIQNDKIKLNVQIWIITFFIEFHEHKFFICTWNLHCTIYGIIIIDIKKKYSLGFTHSLKLLDMCFNFEHKINKNKIYASQ